MFSVAERTGFKCAQSVAYIFKSLIARHNYCFFQLRPNNEGNNQDRCDFIEVHIYLYIFMYHKKKENKATFQLTSHEWLENEMLQYLI